MEAIIHHILAHSGDEKDLKLLCTYLNNAANEAIIATNHASIFPALLHLNKEAHSLGFLHLLHAKLAYLKDVASSTTFVATTRQFLLECSAAQVAMIPDKFVSVCHVFSNLSHNNALAIAPLHRAITSCLPCHSSLTVLHADLFLICLTTKILRPALDLLTMDVFKVSKDLCDARDVLQYYYYGGMIYAAVKRYDKALDFFLMCFVMPCQVVSQILIESYKKCVILSLLLHGTLPSLPRCSSTWLLRYLKNATTSYLELSTAYETHSRQDLIAVIEKNKAEYEADENFGLVLLALDSMSTRAVQRLTCTYGTMSLVEIAVQVGLADAKEAETLILKLISSGDIDATISQADKMVVFKENPQVDGAAVREKLEAHLRMAMTLNEKLRSVDEAVATDPDFLSKLSLHERHARWGEDDAATEGDKPPGFLGGERRME